MESLRIPYNTNKCQVKFRPNLTFPFYPSNCVEFEKTLVKIKDFRQYKQQQIKIQCYFGAMSENYGKDLSIGEVRNGMGMVIIHDM